MMRAKFLLIMMLPLNFAAMAGGVDLLKPEYSRKSLELRRLMEEIAQRGLQYEITHASAKREAFFLHHGWVEHIYHVNYFQVVQIGDSPYLLSGASCTPPGAGYEENVDAPTPTESHVTIDDSVKVHKGILTRLYSRVRR